MNYYKENSIIARRLKKLNPFKLPCHIVKVEDDKSITIRSTNICFKYTEEHLANNLMTVNDFYNIKDPHVLLLIMKDKLDSNRMELDQFIPYISKLTTEDFHTFMNLILEPKKNINSTISVLNIKDNITKEGRVSLRCEEHGDFYYSLEKILNRSNICNKCNKASSTLEYRLGYMLHSESIPFEINDTDTISREVNGETQKLELDFKLNDGKLAIELHGAYYHSTAIGRSRKNVFSHMVEKFKRCEEQGIELLQFYGDEIGNKPDLVMNEIRMELGELEEIDSDDLEVVSVREEVNKLDNISLLDIELFNNKDKPGYFFGLADKNGTIYQYAKFSLRRLISRLDAKKFNKQNNNPNNLRADKSVVCLEFVINKPGYIIKDGLKKLIDYMLEIRSSQGVDVELLFTRSNNRLSRKILGDLFYNTRDLSLNSIIYNRIIEDSKRTHYLIDKLNRFNTRIPFAKLEKIIKYDPKSGGYLDNDFFKSKPRYFSMSDAGSTIYLYKPLDKYYTKKK